MKLVFLLITIIITYGSLFPFNFQFSEIEFSTLSALFHTWTAGTSRGDVLANVILFIPFGYFGMLATRHNGHLYRILLVVFLGFIVGVGLQIAQLYLPGRHASLHDAVWNLVGVALGLIAGSTPLLHPNALVTKRGEREVVPMLLIGSWLCYRLMPFIPSIDWQQIKNSLKPLLLHPQVNLVGVFHDTVAWIIIAYLLSIVAHSRRPEWLLLLSIPVVFGLEVLITMNSVSANNVLGAIIGILLWWGIIARIRMRMTRAGILVVSLMIMLLVVGLKPFELRMMSSTFHWLPFYRFLGGSMLVNIMVLFEKFFLYGSLIWLLRDTGASIRLATIVALIFLMLIELAQTQFIAHTPEITDPILVLITAMLIHSMERKNKDLGMDSLPQRSISSR